MVPKPVEPWPVREKKAYHRPLLAGSLMTLLLLACFVLGRQSASSAACWLQIDLAKLTAMNNGTAGTTNTLPNAATSSSAGFSRQACRSRYESWRYYKYFPYAASPYLQRKLRAYEARHRRCAPGTPLYAKSVEQLRSGRSADAGMECSYVVWLPFDGLGNRMLSMVSGFLYALLTDRVFLVALPPDSTDIFCEPFPADIEKSYTRLLDAKVIGPDANATAAGVPPYVYLSIGWQLKDPLFFCGEHQLVLGKVNWLLLYSDLYFSASRAVADELRRLFPAKESVSHLLSRYLLHPTNPVWSLATRYYRSYLAPAKRRIGVQIRMFRYGADDMFNQILACSRQENILPETDDADDDDDAVVVAVATRSADNGGSNSTAILVASLYADYYERLRSRYYVHAAKGGERVAVFQPSHEEQQATANMAHNQRALAEIYLLSFSEELLTSGTSTFGYVSSNLAGVRPTILLTAYGHKVPDPPCRRAVSMEPCNLTPPKGVQCQSKPLKEDVERHVRVCEDSKNGVKFFD
ncbi:LOW QUALITY PROTEIN: hypothetical protein SORBI_3002G019200 [Sorghum bicolor]|uniref:Fucosyltransferase n=1 Tax=Sorghum bicolor TaxID=4558 RepID=C5X8M5_SORBI|nr:LOW QUALITY PROTEIN: hypothetical protein SORBI_3002G019200 [Sorghum bicolor]